ncbi:hypothetical protein BGZ82_003236 [Podila clonocystis]|nr:hypothetical protein BGZ82_003236 [Podila clonocystis]
MSVADSGMLKRTLAQSRQSWTHGAFTRFYPEPPRAGGKKYSPEVTPAGTCTVCIGPHMFLDTKFFTVYNPPPPPRSFSPSSDPTMSGQQELLEEEHIHTPSLFMGASPGPIPERVIELIMARTAGTPLPPELEEENATEEREAAAALAASSLSTRTTTEATAAITAAISEAIASEENKDLGATEATAMDVDKDESSMDVDVPSVSGEANHTIPSEQTLGVQHTTGAKEDTIMVEPDTVGSTNLKAESEEKALSLSGTSTPLSLSTSLGGSKQKSSSKSSPPRYQVIFEFKENPGVRWLFPSETSLELTPAEDNEPAKISSSFYLTAQDDKKPPSDGISPSSTTPSTSSQATTMVILQVTNELWEGLDRSILDPSLVYRSMMDKMRHIPMRSYVQYTLPVTFTNEDLAPMGLWKLPDNKVVTIKSLQPPKRRNEPNGGRQSKSKRSKPVHEAPVAKPSKKITVPTPVPKQITNKPSEDGRACHYCGTRDTPMWRRGPDGTKTLCNSCGISWKRGKIEVTSGNGAVVSAAPPTPSRTRAPVQQAPVPAPAPRAPTPTPPPPPPPPPPPAAVKTPAPPPKAPAVRAPTPAQTPVAPAPIITTADAAIAILKESLADEPLMANGRPKYIDASLDMRPAYRSGAYSRRTSMGLKRHDPYLSSSSSYSEDDSDDMMPEVELVPLPSKKQRFSKGSPISSGGPKLVPINQISATNSRPTTKPALSRTAGSEKEKEKDTPATTTSTPSTTPTITSTATMALSNTTAVTDTGATATTTAAKPNAIVTLNSTTAAAIALVNSTPASSEATPPTSAGSSTTTEHVSTARSSPASTTPVAPIPSVASAVHVPISAPTKPVRSTVKSTGTKEKTPKSTTTPKMTKKAAAAGVGSTNASPTASTPGAMTPPLTTSTKHSPPTSAVAKMTLLKSPSTTATPVQTTTATKHVTSQSSTASASPSHTVEDGLSLYPSKNLYTNNTATFPLHFPTISIAFGPNNAYYTYPNCAVVLFENHFQIKLMQSGTAERTEIDIWKEAIESTEFHVVDVGDGESMIVLKALLRQFLTRFDKELLNPDKEESLIVFRFRERLDGGGPPVKPLLEQWLTTEIPVATPVETPVGTPKATPSVVASSTSSSVQSSASTTPTTRTGVSNVTH